MVNNWLGDDDFDLDDDDAADRIAALVDENHPALQDALVEVITHPSKAVRREAAFRLAELFQDVRAVPVLAEALDDPDRHIRRSAGAALWDIGDADTRGMIALLTQTHGQERDLIAGALTRIGWQADTAGEDAAYCIAARDWRGCAAIGGPAVPALLASLGDLDGAVRRAAAWTLGQIGDPQAVPGLAGLLNDFEGGMFGVGDRVCDIAAESLQRIGTPEAIQALNQWQPEPGGGEPRAQ